MTKARCSVDGCDRATERREWCNMHYRRWLKHGDPTVTVMPTRPACSIDGCAKPHNARGWCSMHYERWKNHGHPLAGGTFRRPDLSLYERAMLRSSIDPNGCRTYKAGRTVAGGYGEVNGHRAHRVVWEHHNGPIPDGMVVRHRCDNPPCVEITHLEIGTPADNGADRVRRGRTVRGEQNHAAKLSDAIVRDIRTRYAAGGITQKALADEYGITLHTANMVIRRRTWKHVT